MPQRACSLRCFCFGFVSCLENPHCLTNISLFFISETLSCHLACLLLRLLLVTNGELARIGLYSVIIDELVRHS
jgi:hypothetical protein